MFVFCMCVFLVDASEGVCFFPDFALVYYCADVRCLRTRCRCCTHLGFGHFVRPADVEVGDYPEEELSFSSSEDEM